ncbi:MAG: YihY/virulence factor BrkB family protein [Sphingobacteriales bacterium]|nr:MAG: YihY/virulence factor BrkB family protein [Sphingobacteriales bacterium]
MAIKIKTYLRLLKESATAFIDDNGMKLCASLAYYTVFAIGPLLLVILSLAGLFFEQEAVNGKVVYQIQSLVGAEGAATIMDIIKNMQQQNTATKFSIIGIVVLIISATGVFAEIQDSINYIWSIKAKPKKGWLKYLKDRLLSFSLIVGIGFLLIVSLLASTVVDALTERLQMMFADVAVIFFLILNHVITYIVVSGMFAVIYRVLPDARIAWKDALIGASFTGVLFLIGKIAIGLYLGNSDFGNTYGAAASIIILLSWVYYSAIILYFGAEFTKVYALNEGAGIKPYETAVFVVKEEAKELPHKHHKGGVADA